MPNAVISAEEKNRVRHHLGYTLLDPVPSIALGVRVLGQPQFLLENALNLVPESAVGIIRAYIVRLDEIENQLDDARTRFAAQSLGEIKLRDNETDMLEGEYRRWAMRLADDLGVPLNAYSERFRAGSMGKGSVNNPVVNDA